jgi:hypothetical protein
VFHAAPPWCRFTFALSDIPLALICMSIACRASGPALEEMPRDEVWLSDEEVSRAVVRVVVPTAQLVAGPRAGTNAVRLAVPRDAIIKIGERTSVFVPRGRRSDGRHVFKQCPVRVGAEEGGLVSVLDGLEAGMPIVAQASISREHPSDEVWPTPSQIESAEITFTKVELGDLQRKQRLLIPRRSVLRASGQTIAFVSTGRRPDGAAIFKRRPIVVDEASMADTLPVLDGLQPGEIVAVEHAVLLLGMLK